MKKIHFILISLLLCVLIVETVYAMESSNYRVDWNNLLSGSGGTANSSDYQANITIGQTASKTSSSANYQAQLGYWAGMPVYIQFVPRIVKSP
jgi:hypothetical protein